MFELLVFSVVAGIFVKGWLGKLLIFPVLFALYSTLRFYFSPRARQIREIQGFVLLNYLLIMAYKTVFCSAIAGVTSLIWGFFQ